MIEFRYSSLMKISIITPAYGQLDWLKLCVASVADQNQPLKQGSWELGAGSLGGDAPAEQGGRVAESKVGKIANSSLEIVDLEGGSAGNPQQSIIRNQESPIASPLRVEHIIQDGGTPGIEEFARELGVELKTRYGGDFVSDLQAFELLHLRTASGYTLRVFKEPDVGMYDAINKGIAKMSGDLWAWINSDEQYLPGTLAYVAEWFSRHPETDILCGDALLTNHQGGALSYRRIVPPGNMHTRLDHLATLSCASFYQRSIVERGGAFNTEWKSIGDAEWMVRLIQKGVRVKTCHRLLSSYAFTGENTSRSPLASREAERWQAMPDAPPSWLKFPVILLYRIRKLLSGAYRKRTVTYALHEKGAQGRVVRTVRGLEWYWGGNP
jgi:glycosyltransferase involved in cell wall biosynthesis